LRTDESPMGQKVRLADPLLFGRHWEAGFLQTEGVVLHQPLNLQIFRKNDDFGRKMNGPPVCLARKSENAPTWRSPSPFFGPPKSGFFGHFFTPPVPTLPNPSSHPTNHANPIYPHFIFLLFYIHQSNN